MPTGIERVPERIVGRYAMPHATTIFSRYETEVRKPKRGKADASGTAPWGVASSPLARQTRGQPQVVPIVRSGKDAVVSTPQLGSV